MVIEEKTQLSRAVRRGVKKVARKAKAKKRKKTISGLARNAASKPKNLGASLVPDIRPGLEFLKRKTGASFTEKEGAALSRRKRKRKATFE